MRLITHFYQVLDDTENGHEMISVCCEFLQRVLYYAAGRCRQQSWKQYCALTQQSLTQAWLEFPMPMAGKYHEHTWPWNTAPLPHQLNWNNLSQVVLWTFTNCLCSPFSALTLLLGWQFIQKFSFITSTHTYTEKDNIVSTEIWRWRADHRFMMVCQILDS